MSSELRFTPYAWAKLVYMRDKKPLEVGGFGVINADDPSIIEDFVLIKQEVSSVTTDLDGEDIANYLEEMVERGITPEQCARVWLHTHPGNSPTPSGTDEDTFSEIFGASPWAVMGILAKGGQTYARLSVNNTWRATVELNMRPDWSLPFAASDHEAWDKEYADYVTEEVVVVTKKWDWSKKTIATKPYYAPHYNSLEWLVCGQCEEMWKGDPFRQESCPKCQSTIFNTFDEVEDSWTCRDSNT